MVNNFKAAYNSKKRAEQEDFESATKRRFSDFRNDIKGNTTRSDDKFITEELLESYKEDLILVKMSGFHSFLSAIGKDNGVQQENEDKQKHDKMHFWQNWWLER